MSADASTADGPRVPCTGPGVWGSRTDVFVSPGDELFGAIHPGGEQLALMYEPAPEVLDVYLSTRGEDGTFGQLRRGTSVVTWDQVSDLAWNHNGTALYVVVEGDIVQMQYVAGTGSLSLPASSPELGPLANEVDQLAFTADGRTVYAARSGVLMKGTRTDIGESFIELTEIAELSELFEDGRNFSPTLTADGLSIYFLNVHANIPTQAYFARRGSPNEPFTGIERVPSLGEDILRIRISADGSEMFLTVPSKLHTGSDLVLARRDCG